MNGFCNECTAVIPMWADYCVECKTNAVIERLPEASRRALTVDDINEIMRIVLSEG